MQPNKQHNPTTQRSSLLNYRFHLIFFSFFIPQSERIAVFFLPRVGGCWRNLSTAAVFMALNIIFFFHMTMDFFNFFHCCSNFFFILKPYNYLYPISGRSSLVRIVNKRYFFLFFLKKFAHVKKFLYLCTEIRKNKLLTIKIWQV